MRIVVSNVTDFARVASAFRTASYSGTPQTLEVVFEAGRYTGGDLILGGMQSKGDVRLLLRGPPTGAPAILDGVAIHIAGRHARIADLVWTGSAGTGSALRVLVDDGVELTGLRFLRQRVSASSGRGSMQERGFVVIKGRGRGRAVPTVNLRDVWFLGNTVEGNTPLLELKRPNAVDVGGIHADGLLIAGNTPGPALRSDASVQHTFSNLRLDLAGGVLLARTSHPERPKPLLVVDGAQRADNGPWVSPTADPAEQLAGVVTSVTLGSNALDALIDSFLSGDHRRSLEEASRSIGFQ